ncbi:MAG: hypothetical protein JW940_19170 [Polyangiaceae bacterium]|nr:hypothetical protein [Polyangiaceae bacterium]
MTVPKIERIGLVYDFSEQGDWALSAALQLGRAREATLNVYHFLESPYEVPLDVAPADLSAHRHEAAILVQKDRELREHLDDRLGDFENVRFRVCESGRHNKELRQCLLHREYQLLVIPYLREGVSFGNMPIEEFAYRYGAPVMLVGPQRESPVCLNPFAAAMDGAKTLGFESWRPIAEPAELQTRSVV